MTTIKINAQGDEVVILQQLLDKWGYHVLCNGIFDEVTDKAVKAYQKAWDLTIDGIVGPKTWKCLLDETALNTAKLRVNEEDLIQAAQILNVDLAAIKAVKLIESGRQGGFIDSAHPTILFEGHIFWKLLKQKGINPIHLTNGNEDILYPKWTKKFYKGGIKEYQRLEKAKLIDEDSALCSASWGLFQILGSNYKSCNCNSVKEFVTKMSMNEGEQLRLLISFLKNSGWDVYLRAHNWAEFAKHYNGPIYAANQYDVKLKAAYDKYSQNP